MSDAFTSANEAVTLFEAVGGMSFFERLVDAFYEGVVTDAVLRPLYPDDDIDGARHRLTLFLAQYWGGPTTYNEERGHPMLRARHMPFHVGPTERDRWLLHMAAAVERCTPPGESRDMLRATSSPPPSTCATTKAPVFRCNPAAQADPATG